MPKDVWSLKSCTYTYVPLTSNLPRPSTRPFRAKWCRDKLDTVNVPHLCRATSWTLSSEWLVVISLGTHGAHQASVGSSVSLSPSVRSLSRRQRTWMNTAWLVLRKLRAAKHVRRVRRGPLKGPHGPVGAEGESEDSRGDWLQVATSARLLMPSYAFFEPRGPGSSAPSTKACVQQSNAPRLRAWACRRKSAKCARPCRSWIQPRKTCLCEPLTLFMQL